MVKKAYETQAFRDWVKKKLRFEHRSINDTVSRIRRVHLNAKISGDMSDDKIIELTKKAVEFKGTSMSVRSQLKRAAMIYRDFLRSQ